MFDLVFSKNFLKKRARLIEKEPLFESKIEKTLKLLANRPYHPSLKTHKVIIERLGSLRSSWITGDLRLMWDYGKEDNTIELLTLGGHTGSGKVYK